MQLDQLAGNRRVKEILNRQEQGRGLSHAYLLSGPKGSGRHTLARLLAAAMLCTGGGEKPCGLCPSCRRVMGDIHPDVSALPAGDEKKPLSVDQIRQLRRDAYIRPNQGARKIYILDGADQMNASAQNAMLKLLEEGPAYGAFLLVAENAGGVLETVRSRCEQLILTPEDGPEGGEKPEEALRLARAMEQGSETELMEAALRLEKLNREDLCQTPEETFVELGRLARTSPHRGRALRGAALLSQLRGAAALNVGGGALAGWLCGQMFWK